MPHWENTLHDSFLFDALLTAWVLTYENSIYKHNSWMVILWCEMSVKCFCEQKTFLLNEVYAVAFITVQSLASLFPFDIFITCSGQKLFNNDGQLQDFLAEF
jgi:hypothetical protein